MNTKTGTRLRRGAAFVAAFSLLGVYQWSGGGEFGPTADPNRPAPVPGSIENELGDRIIRDDDFYNARAFPNDAVPAGALEAAFAEAELLPVITETRALPTTDTVIAPGPLAPAAQNDFTLPTTGVNWTQAGTQGITGYTRPGGATGTGDTFYNGTAPLSGRVVAIANHPTIANTAYIGSPSGGLFKTTDGGTTWTALFDAQTTLNVSAISIPSDAPNTLYVGTGEGSGGLYYGQGVYKSTDGGANWAKVPIGPGGTALDYCHIADVLALPGGIVNVAVSRASGTQPAGSCMNNVNASTGVWYSADAGATWAHTRVSSGATDLAVDSVTATTVYAGDRDAGMIDSSDSGANWLTTAATIFLTGAGQVKLAAADGGVVYAAVERASDATLRGIYKSVDSGANYTLLSAPNDICNYPGTTVAQCSYDFDIAVDTRPAGPDVVYLAGIFLGRSTDGGVNWSYSGNNPGVNTLADKQIHVDVQKLSFDSTMRLWVGTDGGIQRTTDGTTFTNINANLNLQQFQHGISTTPDGRFYGGTQDLGSTRYTGGPGWQMWGSGDGGTSAVDPSNTQIVYGTYIQGNTYKSTDGGATTTPLAGTNCYGEGAGGCLFYPPLEMDPSNPSTIYVGGNAMYRTTDGWATQPTPISQSFGAPISAIAPAASNSQVIYAGTAVGALHVATDGGTTNPASWPLRTTGLPMRAITDILVNPTNANHAWVAFSGFGTGHVYETTDAGMTWTNRSGDLPDVPVNAIDGDFRTSPANLFVGTDVGVFGSSNNGTAWARYGTGLPNITVRDVVVNSARNTLTAGTAGRGMWTVPAGCAVPANDLYANATTLTGATATATGTNTCASTEFGEPKHNTAGKPLPTNTMWWKWTAPGNGNVTINTTGSAINTVLAVYTGAAIQSLTQVAQNDDISGADNKSSVTFPVTAGTTYRIAVDGYDIAALGNVTVNVAATLSPSAPTNVKATVGNGSATVSWDAAAPNGSPVTGYTVTASPGGATCTTTSTSCTVTGLTNGTTYTFSVAAKNAVGTGSAGTVNIVLAQKPTAPTNVTATPGNGTVTVTWTAATAVGAPVTGYTVTAAPGGATCTTTTAVTCTVSGLTNGTQYTFSVTATNVAGTGVAGTTTATPGGQVVTALSPGRVYETRVLPNTTDDGQQTAQGRTSAGQVVEVQVAGRANVPANAVAAVINITAIRPSTGGFITPFPCGTTRPNTAALNFGAGDVIANGATIKLGTGGTNAGKVCVYTTSAMDLVVDVTGYVPVGSVFGALTPGRVYETRVLPNTTADGQQTAQGRTTAGQTVEVQVAGRSGVPANADSAVINITAIRPSTGGFITPFPCGTTRPNTAALNFAAGQVIANGANIKLGTGGTNAGKVCIYTTSAMDLVVDVTGFIPATTQFGALTPGRVYETRVLPNTTADGQQTAQGHTTAGQIVEVQVAGRSGVPANAAAAVLNITAIRPATGGFITSFPCGTTQPNTAALNFAAGQVIANGAIIKLGTGGTNAGKVCVFTSSAMDLVVDVTGYLSA